MHVNSQWSRSWEKNEKQWWIIINKLSNPQMLAISKIKKKCKDTSIQVNSRLLWAITWSWMMKSCKCKDTSMHGCK
jgi:hypothetical protein